jgi:xylose isomerase
MNGASTNPDFAVVANAAVQVKNAIDATIALGGTGYVFWGREGYMSLHNTNTKKELDHMGQFLRMARDYARAQDLKEHSSSNQNRWSRAQHQYDVDVQTVLGFLMHRA